MSDTPNNPIRASDVETALNSGGVAIYASSTSPMSFNDYYVRYLAGRTNAGTSISMNDMRSKPGPQYIGTEISSVCNGTTLNQILADGKYKSYPNTIDHSLACAPAAGTTVGVPFCVGSNLVQKYNDGNYGTYDAIIQTNSPSCGLTLTTVDRYVNPDRLAYGYFGPGYGGSLSPLTGSGWMGDVTQIWTSDVDNNGAPQYTTLVFSTNQYYAGNYKITDLATNKQMILYGSGINWTTDPSPYDERNMFRNWMSSTPVLIRIERV